MADLSVSIRLAAEDLASPKIGAVESALGRITGAAVAGFGLEIGYKAFELLSSGIQDVISSTVNFQAELTRVQNNTTMTAADVGQMHDAVLKLGSDTGASFEGLGQGFMHITNLTGDAAHAVDILSVANESAISTGGNVSQVANVLANAMHEYGLDVSHATDETAKHIEIQQNAAHVMGVMHLAAAEANMTLEQFSQSGGQVFAWAANLHVPMEEASAAFATMTKHGFDSAEAGTQVKDMLEHLIKVTPAATTELEKLSRRSGIDLVHDFSAAGLEAKGLSGVVEDLHATFTKLGMSETDQTAEVMKLIPNIRGGAAMFTLLGTGADDFHTILNDLNDSEKVNNITAESMANTQKTVAFQMGVLGQSVNAAAIQIGEVFLPRITPVITALAIGMPGALAAAGDAFSGAAVATQPLRDALDDLAQHALTEWGQLKDAAQQLFAGDIPGALTTALSAIGSFDGYLIDHLARWVVSFDMWVLDAIPGLMSNLGDMLGQLGDWIGGAGKSGIDSKLPAWITAFTDWAGQVYGPLLARLNVLGDQLGAWITGYALPFMQERLTAWGTAFIAWVGPAVSPLIDQLGVLGQQLFAWINAQVPVVTAQLVTWGREFVAWVQPQIPPLLSALGALGSQLIGWLGQQVPVVAGQLLSWGKEFVAWVGPQIPPLLGELASLLGSVTNFIVVDALPKIVGSLVGWGIKFVSWVSTDVLPNLPAALAEILNAITSWATGAAPQAAASASTIGSAMVDGIGGAIAAGIEGLKRNATAAIGNMIAAMKAAADIHSPSRVFYDEIGVPIVLGLQQALVDGRGTIAVASTDLVNVSASTMQTLADQATEVFAAKMHMTWDQAALWLQAYGVASNQVLSVAIPAQYGITDLAVETFADVHKTTWDDARAQLTAAAAHTQATLGTGGLIPTATSQTGAALVATQTLIDEHTRPALDQLQDAAKKLASQGFDTAKDAATQISFVLQQLNDKMPDLISHTHAFTTELLAIPRQVDINVVTHYSSTGSSSGGGSGGGVPGDGSSGPGGSRNDPSTGQPRTADTPAINTGGGGQQINSSAPGAGRTNPNQLAVGGIVTGPTYALIGEAGPEAIIPLGEYFVSHKSDSGGSGGGMTDAQMQRLASMIAAELAVEMQHVRLSVGVDDIHSKLLQKARRGTLGLS